MKLKLIKNGKTIDLSKAAADLTLSDSIDTLGMELAFTLAINKEDRYWLQTEPEVGDKVQFGNLFQGILTNVAEDGRMMRTCRAYDYGFYLNKSEVIAQFNKMAADAAIKKLCSQFGIPVGNVCAMPTKVDKIYNGEILADVIKDIISQAEADMGQRLRLEMRLGKLHIEKWADLLIKVQYQPAPNIAPFDQTAVPGSWQAESSMEDMYTIVYAKADTEKAKGTIAEAKNMECIKKYGYIQKVEIATDKDSAQLGNVAKNTLAELCQVKKQITVTIMGDINVRAGRLIDMKGKGRYLVRDCQHRFANGMHTMRLGLEERA